VGETNAVFTQAGLTTSYHRKSLHKSIFVLSWSRYILFMKRPATTEKACIKVFLCCHGHAIYIVYEEDGMESLLKIAGMKFEL